MSNDLMFAELPMGKISYAEFGSLDGAPVMYFHGWPGSRIQASLAEQAAKEHQLRVIAPDRPGLGRSPYRPRRVMTDWPAQVAQLADHLNWDRFSVLGVSGGGPYALACGALLPDRIARVGICCGVPYPDWLRHPTKSSGRSRALVNMRDNHPFITRIVVSGMRRFVRNVPAGVVLRPVQPLLPPADRKNLANPKTREFIGRSISEAFYGPVDGLLLDAELLVTDWGFDPSEIRTEIAFWHGSQDTVCPLSQAEETMAKIPHAQTFIYPDEGHYSLPVNRIDELLSWYAPESV